MEHLQQKGKSVTAPDLNKNVNTIQMAKASRPAANKTGEPEKETAAQKAARLEKELATAQEKLKAKDVELREKKGTITTVKNALETEKAEKKNFAERLEQAERKIKAFGDNVGEAVSDTRGWLNRGNKWAFAAVPVLIFLIWLFLFDRPRHNQADSTIELKTDTINRQYRLIRQLENKWQSDSTRNLIDGFPKRSEKDEVKKKPSRKLLLTA